MAVFAAVHLLHANNNQPHFVIGYCSSEDAPVTAPMQGSDSCWYYSGTWVKATNLSLKVGG